MKSNEIKQVKSNEIKQVKSYEIKSTKNNEVTLLHGDFSFQPISNQSESVCLLLHQISIGKCGEMLKKYFFYCY